MFSFESKEEALANLKEFFAAAILETLEECDADEELRGAVAVFDAEAVDNWFEKSPTDMKVKVHLHKFVQFLFSTREQLELETIRTFPLSYFSTREDVENLEAVIFRILEQAIVCMLLSRDPAVTKVRATALGEILEQLRAGNWQVVNDLAKRNASQLDPDQLFDLGQLSGLYKSYARKVAPRIRYYGAILVG